MKQEQYLFCPHCDAGLIANTDLDYFETNCTICGKRLAAQRDLNQLYETSKVRAGWSFPFTFMLP